MTAWAMCRASNKDREIADNYASAARVAARYQRGELSWEEATKRWAFQDSIRAALWRERGAIS